MRNAYRRRHQRTASVTLEFILVLPFLVILVLAGIQFSVALLMRQAVTQGATVAAREAGKGESISEVARVTDAILDGAHCLDVATVDTMTMPATVTAVAGSGVRIVQEVGQPDAYGRPASIDFGDPTVTCTPPALPVLTAGQVRVTVCLDLSTQPMCNWLYSFNDSLVDFSDRCFQVSSLVNKE